MSGAKTTAALVGGPSRALKAAGTWAPFRSGIDPIEQKAQLRSLRLAVRLLCGARGAEVAHQLLLAEVDPHPEVLEPASAAFERLRPLDRRQVLSAFQASLPPAGCLQLQSATRLHGTAVVKG